MNEIRTIPRSLVYPKGFVKFIDLTERPTYGARRVKGFGYRESRCKKSSTSERDLLQSFARSDRAGCPSYDHQHASHHRRWWSLSVAVRDFNDRYTALMGRKKATFPLPIQYLHYAAWNEREQVRRGLFDRQINYWKRKLAGAPPLLELPTIVVDQPYTVPR